MVKIDNLPCLFFLAYLQRANKSENKLFGKEKPSVSDSPKPETVEVSHPHPLPPLEDVNLAEAENEQTKHAYSVAVASAAAAEAAVAAAQAAAEVVRLTKVSEFAGKSIEEVAAIKVQTAFRGYLVSYYTIFPFISFSSELDRIDIKHLFFWWKKDVTVRLILILFTG